MGARIEGCENLLDRSVIARNLTDMRVGHRVARPDHKHATELPRVAVNAGLAGTGSQCPRPIDEQSRREQLEVSATQSRGPVRTQRRVDEHRAVQPELVAEPSREKRGAVSDDGKLCPAFADFVDRVAQLRDLLTAEQSTEVSDESENDRTFGPERAETLGLRRLFTGADGLEFDVGQSTGEVHFVLNSPVFFQAEQSAVAGGGVLHDRCRQRAAGPGRRAACESRTVDLPHPAAAAALRRALASASVPPL